MTDTPGKHRHHTLAKYPYELFKGICFDSHKYAYVAQFSTTIKFTKKYKQPFSINLLGEALAFKSAVQQRIDWEIEHAEELKKLAKDKQQMLNLILKEENELL